MKRVIVETPFAATTGGWRDRNMVYLRAAMRDCLERGEAPFASHRMYTDCLDDGVPEERALGIEAGLTWGAVAEATVVYVDLGVSPGMQQGIDRARQDGRPYVCRSLSGWGELYGAKT